jgi:hypothetical protein
MNKKITIILTTFIISFHLSATYFVKLDSKHYKQSIVVKTIYQNGFNNSGIHKDTGTLFNSEGYDKEGYDINGFNEEYIHKDTGTLFNSEGYDKEGFDSIGLNVSNYDRNGEPANLCKYGTSPDYMVGEVLFRTNDSVYFRWNHEILFRGRMDLRDSNKIITIDGFKYRKYSALLGFSNENVRYYGICREKL